MALRTAKRLPLYRHFQSLLKLKNHAQKSSVSSHLISSSPFQSSSVSSICNRPFSLLALFKRKEDAELINSENFKEKDKKSGKPLDVFFKEAVGILEKSKDNETESESESESEYAELKKRLRKLEVAFTTLNGERKDDKDTKKKKKNEGAEDDDGQSKPGSLSSLFEVAKTDDGRLKNERKPGKSSSFFEGAKTDDGQSKYDPKPGSLSALVRNKAKDSKKLTMENDEIYKELSADMELFVTHLYTKGYFVNSNFLPRNRLDMTCFENSYGRDFIRFAAVQFGKDNQEIAKWLSGSDLKKVALFGCPSLGRKNVFSAKRLRAFFKIQENTVCGKCSLKESCKFANQSVWNTDINNLNLAVVMRVITQYALDSVPPQLAVPDEIKTAACRLLKEVIKLSETVR